MTRGEAREHEARHQLGVGDHHAVSAHQVQVLGHSMVIRNLTQE